MSQLQTTELPVSALTALLGEILKLSYRIISSTRELNSLSHSTVKSVLRLLKAREYLVEKPISMLEAQISKNKMETDDTTDKHKHN